MAYKVEWTARAETDIEKIISYIANDLASPKAAGEHLDAFLTIASTLETNPEIYAISSVPALSRRDLRRCIVKNYAVIFSIEGSRVVVWRVFHMSQDYAKLL